ncbi:MAG: VOC family protein [Actinomycetota bacterium]
MSTVHPIPDGYPRVTAYLCVDGAAEAIAFYGTVFGATERMRMASPDGKVGHAELVLGDSLIMLSDPFPEMGVAAPARSGDTASITLNVYVEDVDAAYERALQAGATAVRPVENQFYGDRSGQFDDPFGHRWNVASHVEDVSPDEIARRAAAMMAAG